MDADELYANARKAHAAGWQLGTHANGDVGIGMVCDLYERLQREMPRRDPRYRIEHCTVVNDSLVARMKALGAIPTPFASYVYFHGEKMPEYGEERLNHMFALRSFLDAGIRPTMGSDYPPGPFEPMMALQSMVTRTALDGHVWGPKQKITVEEALRVCTLNGAYASFEEQLKGLARARQARRPRGARAQPAHRGPVDAGHDPRRAHDGGRTLGVRVVIRRGGRERRIAGGDPAAAVHPARQSVLARSRS